eukprot:3731968-Pyramimonas_sp.AAC.1
MQSVFLVLVLFSSSLLPPPPLLACEWLRVLARRRSGPAAPRAPPRRQTPRDGVRPPPLLP